MSAIAHAPEFTIAQEIQPIAVVMAVYNGERFLEEQIVSILNQSYPNLHLYVRDDGSTDQSIQIIKSLSTQYPGRITLLQIENQRLGVVGNFQRLLEMVLQRGEEPYIMLADQDDIWFPDKVAGTLQTMRAMELWSGTESPLLVHTNLCVTDAHLQILDHSFWHYQHLNPARDDIRSLCMQNMVTGCTVMVNRPLLQKALPIPDSAMMHDWWLALVASVFGVIGYLPQATMYYRQHDRNDTGAQKYTSGGYILQAIRRRQSGTGFWQAFQRLQKQVAAFLERYREELEPTLAADLEAFVFLGPQSPRKDRIRIIFSRRFRRHGWIRTLGLAARLLTI